MFQFSNPLPKIIYVAQIERGYLMKLSLGQKHSIEALSRILSLETLLKIRKGQIGKFDDLNLNLFSPSTAEEKDEMHHIIEKEIADRRKKLRKAIHINC